MSALELSSYILAGIAVALLLPSAIIWAVWEIRDLMKDGNKGGKGK